MARRLADSFCLLSSLILIGIAVLTIRTYPAPLVLEIIIGTGASIALSTVIVVAIRKAQRPSLNAVELLDALTLLVIGQAISIGAIHGLPSISNAQTVYALHLGVVYRILHYGVSALVTARVLFNASRDRTAEIGLVAVLVYAAMSGGLFQIGGIGFNLLWGLSLATGMIYLRERRVNWRPRTLPPLSMPILAFLLGALFSTVTSLYVHQSFAMLIRIGNWILVFFLIVGIVREEAQLHRLLVVLLLLATVVALSGLRGTVEYAEHAGWVTALSSRLRLGRLHSNGVAVFVVAYAVLAFGMFVAWKSRMSRILSGLAFVSLLACAFLTHCRSAGAGLGVGLMTIILLRMGRRPVFSTGKRRLILWLGLAITLLLAGSLVFTRSLEGSLQTRLALWKVALNEIAYRPFLGIGPGIKSIPFFRGVLSHEEAEAIKHTVGSHSHNLVLEIGRSLGLVGLALFSWVIFAAFQYSRSALSLTEGTARHDIIAALLATMVALLIPHGLVLTLSENTLLPLSFWVILGLVIAAAEGSPRHDDSAAVPGGPERREMPPPVQSQLIPSLLVFIAVVVIVVRPVLAELVLGTPARVRDKGGFTSAAGVPRLATHLEPFWAELSAQRGDRSTDTEAISNYERAVQLRPYSAAYHATLGWLYWAEDRFDRAVTQFEAASALDHHSRSAAQYRHDLGLARVAAGRREGALEAFQDAVLMVPSILRPPDWVGSKGALRLSSAYARYARTQRVDEELSALIDRHMGRAADVPPDSTDRGPPTMSIQDVAGGLRAMAENTEGSAYSQQVLFALARFYQAQRMWIEMEHTLSYLEPLTTPHTSSRAEVQVLRAWAYRGQGRMVVAENELRRALLDYDDHVVRAELGRILLRMGKAAEATNQLRQAVKSWRPDRFSTARWAQYWRDLARCHLRRGDLNDALEACDMALFLHLPFPSYARTKMQIARSYHRQNEYEKEREVYAAILAEMSGIKEARAPNQRILRDVAKGMVTSHRKQGLFTGDALIQSAQQIEVKGPLGKRYRERFVNEVRNQFRTAD
jgi:tetratricopeptide (TPR) repeat protein/O-antigen ligase